MAITVNDSHESISDPQLAIIDGILIRRKEGEGKGETKPVVLQGPS